MLHAMESNMCSLIFVRADLQGECNVGVQVECLWLRSHLQCTFFSFLLVKLFALVSINNFIKSVKTSVTTNPFSRVRTRDYEFVLASNLCKGVEGRQYVSLSKWGTQFHVMFYKYQVFFRNSLGKETERTFLSDFETLLREDQNLSYRLISVFHKAYTVVLFLFRTKQKNPCGMS